MSVLALYSTMEHRFLTLELPDIVLPKVSLCPIPLLAQQYLNNL